MVYLPGNLSRTRSRNASNLYQDQAAMGVVPPERPAAPPQPGGGVSPSAEGGFTPGGQARPSRLTQYIQAQQQQREMLASRGEDLRIAQLMSRALDPSMPKGFRQLGLRQISQILGVDPRGDRAKEIINTISGLDPQSLEGLRRGIVGSTNDAQPGEITQLARGVLTGQVPPDQLLQMASATLRPPAAEGGGEESTSAPAQGPSRLGGLTGADAGSIVTQAQAPIQQSSPTVTGDTGERYPPTRQLFSPVTPVGDPEAARESAVSPARREVIPELAGALGLDPTQRYRVQDLAAAGYQVPSNEASMRAMASDIRSTRSALVNSFTMISQLAGLVRGRPEALDYPQGFHLPTSLVQAYDYGRGVLRMLGLPDPDLENFRQVYNGISKDDTATIADKVMGWVPGIVSRGMDAAETRARIQAIVVPLAFAMAAAEGQTGRHLSDKDVQLQLQRLGRSNSPQQFLNALGQTSQLLYNQFNTRMMSTIGQELPLGPAISPDIAAAWRVGGLIAPPGEDLPPGVVAQGETAPARATAPSAPATPPGPGFGLDIGGERTEMPAGPQPSTSAAPAEPPAAPAAPAAPTAPARQGAIPRVSPTLEESEAAARARLQEERDYLHETRYQQRRGLELRESAEARAQRAEQEQRRARIQQAFAQIGAALRGAISGGGAGGGVGGMGGEQDPSAFRIAPPPQRRPPTPVPAAPFQPQLPQQRRR